MLKSDQSGHLSELRQEAGLFKSSCQMLAARAASPRLRLHLRTLICFCSFSQQTDASSDRCQVVHQEPRAVLLGLLMILPSIESSTGTQNMTDLSFRND